MASVLVVDDDVDIAKALVRMLASRGYEAVFAPGGQQALEVLKERRFDAVVTDVNMPQVSGIDLLRSVKENRSARAVIVATAYGSLDLAVEAMQLGACDFLTKPYAFTRLDQALKMALAADAFLPAPTSAGWRERNAPEIVGEDASIARLLTTIERISDVDSNVLIQGESGTGKELIARTVHRSSRRGSGPFVAINCAAIPENLVESELFGHTKGAFTGAVADKRGRFQLADGGTLFLDEIGEMNLGMQAKLLRAIQEHEVTPVGEVESQRVNVRIVAATNRELKKCVEQKTFREDLFFRLNVIPLRIAPLRERSGDIASIVAHVIARVNKGSGRHITGVAPPALERLVTYAWPGNVRELENFIERVVVIKGEGQIELDDLSDLDGSVPNLPNAAGPIDFSHPVAFKAAVEDFEMSIIDSALRSTQGNQTKAAELLGINRTTLIEKLRRRQNS